MSNEKIKLFSDSDLDGVSCGVLATFMFGNNVDITYCTPKDIDDTIKDFINSKEYENYKRVFITDLVIKEPTANMIDETDQYKFKMFDHHKSNYINNKFIWANVYESLLKRKTCGTELFWNHLKDYYITGPEEYNVVDKYVEYVRLWDTWDWINSDNEGIYARDLNTIFNIYSKSKFVNCIVNRLASNDDLFLKGTEKELINIEEARKSRYINQKMKNIRTLDIDDYKIAYVFAESYISELGNYIVKNMTDVKYAAIINVDAGVVSLRALASAEVDLSKIAKSFSTQGGGHPLSAGFVFDKEYVDPMINLIFKK